MQFINYKINSTTYGLSYVGHLLANDEIKLTFIGGEIGWFDMSAFIYSSSKHSVMLFRDNKSLENILIYKNNKDIKNVNQYRLNVVIPILDELKGKTFNNILHFIQTFNDKQKKEEKNDRRKTL